MGSVCELCGAQEAGDTRFGIQLCQECLNGYENVMRNNIAAVEKYAREADFPNATENAKQQIISLAKRKLDAGVENLKPKEVEASTIQKPEQSQAKGTSGSKDEKLQNRQSSVSANIQPTGGQKNTQSNSQYAAQRQQTSQVKPSVNPVLAANKNETLRKRYKKVLSTSQQREWIEKYISLKRFVAFIYTCLGLIIGFLIGRMGDYGWDIEMFLLLAVGAGIGGVCGTNAVGSAMMEAITAEQSLVNEDLLTEILDNMKK